MLGNDNIGRRVTVAVKKLYTTPLAVHVSIQSKVECKATVLVILRTAVTATAATATFRSSRVKT